jgi:hypothetical protein
MPDNWPGHPPGVLPLTNWPTKPQAKLPPDILRKIQSPILTVSGAAQVIPEGAGPVKTNGCVCFCLFWSFLVLVGHVEVGVGGDAVRRMLFRAGRSELLVLLSA